QRAIARTIPARPTIGFAVQLRGQETTCGAGVRRSIHRAAGRREQIAFLAPMLPRDQMPTAKEAGALLPSDRGDWFPEPPPTIAGSGFDPPLRRARCRSARSTSRAAGARA